MFAFFNILGSTLWTQVRRIHADMTSIGYLAHIGHAFAVMKADRVIGWRSGWVSWANAFLEPG